METLITVNLFVFMVVCFITTVKGLDLKKRSSWLYGLYGFISGFSVGFLAPNDAVTNLSENIQGGILFACIVLIGGATTRKYRMLGEQHEALAEKNLQEKLGNLAETLFKGKSSRKQGKHKP